jgi:phosphoribosyl 1,2-cyclic phosphodiesterase
MGLKICSLSSGSSGNCVFVASDSTRIIVDAGIPAGRIGRALGALPLCGELSVLVTHSHYDHISGLSAFTKTSGARVYTHGLSSGAVRHGDFNNSEFNFSPFMIGDIEVEPFAVPHDVPCVGFILKNGSKSVGIATDLGEADGSVINRLSFCDMVLIESNYDENMLRGGPYPQYLKKRVLSREGHLSNDACAGVCAEIVSGRVKQIMLAHLSRQNNSPAIAFNTVADKLLSFGIVEGRDVNIEVAPAFSASGLYEIG